MNENEIAKQTLERHKQADEQALLEAYAEGVKAGQALAQAEIYSLKEDKERLTREILDLLDEKENPRPNI